MKLEATTTQSHCIKQFFSSLKEQTSETELDCHPEGIRIVSIDTSHIVCVHADLNASGFEYFKCDEAFSIGIDVMAVNRILKHTVSGDILTIFVDSDENDDCSGDRFGIKIQNNQKAEDCVFHLDAIDTNVDKFSPEEPNYPVRLTMPSADLQSIIGRLKNTGGEVLQLIYKNDTLTFRAKGDVARATLNRRKPDNDVASGTTSKKDTTNDIITVYLGINKVSEFTKCTNLSNFVTIDLRNDDPVFFEYQIGSLGKIRLGLSQRAAPENW